MKKLKYILVFFLLIPFCIYAKSNYDQSTTYVNSYTAVMGNYDTYACGDGGSGFNDTFVVNAISNKTYSIVVGKSSNDYNDRKTSAFGHMVYGGSDGRVWQNDSADGAGGNSTYGLSSSYNILYSSKSNSVPKANTGGAGVCMKVYVPLKMYGASGVVVIRNSRSSNVKFNYKCNNSQHGTSSYYFTYSGDCEVNYETNTN